MVLAELLPAVSLLSKPIVAETKKVSNFTSQFNTLASILTSIEHVFDDIQKNLNHQMDRPHTEAFTLLFSQGQHLLHNCSRIKRWDFINRWRYSNKLTSFEDQLRTFNALLLPVLCFRELTRISVPYANLNEQEVSQSSVSLERMPLLNGAAA